MLFLVLEDLLFDEFFHYLTEIMCNEYIFCIKVYSPHFCISWKQCIQVKTLCNSKIWEIGVFVFSFKKSCVLQNLILKWILQSFKFFQQKTKILSQRIDICILRKWYTRHHRNRTILGVTCVTNLFFIDHNSSLHWFNSF